MDKKITIEQAEAHFDEMFNKGKNNIDKSFYEYKRNLGELISNKIVDEYEELIKIEPNITDGKMMFEYWAWEFYRAAMSRMWVRQGGLPVLR